MTESARAEVDINLRIAALRSLELGIYFKSLWRLPIARHAAGRRGWRAPRVGGSGGFWPAARPRSPWLSARRPFSSRGEFADGLLCFFSFRSTAKMAS